ncbi:hypothetical protein BCY89_11220 [Sphingobacterium siyangense]|uniref:Uncharacterized protein n=1 Tax=Sphingobacterium siyangense TaxID=459529 RepID=A0A420FMM6_9SPHI|nr:hypothetical protein [Sphingobacterium siyangense]RKF34198.1 hypothetical protein BCY89_11220 [Sphingobacterium siyangense]
MTFEEFFIKKKIDLKALQAADGPLFEEFKAHYSAMGEKSFDHSKKFWFNKLRKSFHLAEEETVIAKPIVKQVIADTASETSSIHTAKPAGFKPRFKAPPTVVENEVKATSKKEITDSAESTPDSIPTGFKPRFKAGATKAPDAAASTSASEEKTDETTNSAPKPTGFKPRFKAGVTKTETPEQAQLPDTKHEIKLDTNVKAEPENSSTETQESAASKPTGFKPRFKAGVTKTETSEQAQLSDTKDEIKLDNSVKSEPENSSIEPQESAASKPTGFKPRFKAGVTKTETSEQAQLPDTKDEIKLDTSVKAEPENSSIEPQEPAASKPTGFKPRFKGGVTKTETSEQAQLPDTKHEIKLDTNVKAEPENSSTETQESAASKPTGFKPRFKAGVNKTETSEQAQLPDTKDEIKLDTNVKAEPENSSVEPQEPAASKPTGFKPRFKAGVTKTENPEQAQLPDTKHEIKLDTNVKAEPESSSTETQEPAASKPTGFKPRFKAGVNKTETSEQAQLPDTKDEIKLDTNVKAEPENSSVEPQEPAASKPTGFKPRFKAGITKIDKKEE